MSVIQIVIWVVLIGAALLFFFGGRKNRKKYEGRTMEITADWYQQSQIRYSPDPERKAWFFEFDKNFLSQGHRMVDQDHQPVYEAKILYGDMVSGYEADFTNHVIGYTHHHKLSAVATNEAASGSVGVVTSSYFKFDGVNIWDYLRSLGYDYHFRKMGLLAWQLEVMKDDGAVGTIYSSNNGKNYFGCSAPFTAKAGSNGMYVVECAERDMDAIFLLAMAFARTEFSLENLK